MATPALTPSTVGPELRLEGVPGAAPPDSACLPEVVADVPRGTAGAVVLDHVALQVKKIKANVPLVRADEHDAVHQMRVGARRLRSALTTFRPLLDRDVTDGLRGELRWLGQVLGGARDAEVIRDQLCGLLLELPPEEVRGPVEERVVGTMTERYRTAHARVLEEIDGDRYAALLAALDTLIVDPPLSRSADQPQQSVLPLVARTFSRLERLNEQLTRTHGRGRPPVLHEIRKAAKAARYAGDAMVPVYGAPAKHWAGHMSGIQDALGTYQDTVVIRGELRTLVLAALEHFEDSFTYGRLEALEQARAQLAQEAYAQAWEGCGQASLHAWLRD